jgi:uncharacterized protein DUF5658
MAYGTALSDHRVSDSASVGISVNWRRGRRYCRPATRVCWLLLILFTALQIADVVTTNCALSVPGVWEANPLMALMQARLGAAWWLPKVAVVGFVCLATPLLRRRWPMIVVVSYYAMIVSINIAHL